MSQPKHFRELLPVKPKRQPKRVLPPKPGLVLTPEYIEQQERKKKEMVAFSNTLRCPLCASQLDGGCFPDRASLYCRRDPDHFTCEYDSNRALRSQVFRLAFNQRGYTIQASMVDNEVAQISVFVLDRTFEYQAQEKYRIELFHYTGCLPEITTLISEQELIDELKLMALFS